MKILNYITTFIGFDIFMRYLQVTHMSIYVNVAPEYAVIVGILGFIIAYIVITIIQIKKPKNLRRITNKLIISCALLAHGIPLLFNKHQIHDTKIAIITITLGILLLRDYIKKRPDIVEYYNSLQKPNENNEQIVDDIN